MNDNKAPPPAELLKQKVLTQAASIETHMTTGLNVLLMRSGVSQQFAETMTGFVRPILELLKGIEIAVVGHASKEQIADLAAASIHDFQTRSLEAWGDVLLQSANTPQQLKTARGFKNYVDEMIKGREPEKGRESRGKGIERE